MQGLLGSLTSLMMLGKTLNLLGTQFPYMESGRENKCSSRDVLGLLSLDTLE